MSCLISAQHLNNTSFQKICEKCPRREITRKLHSLFPGFCWIGNSFHPYRLFFFIRVSYIWVSLFVTEMYLLSQLCGNIKLVQYNRMVSFDFLFLLCRLYTDGVFILLMYRTAPKLKLSCTCLVVLECQFQFLLF